MSKTTYPLAWPSGWPRTEKARREGAKFKSSLASALNKLRFEIEHLGGKGLILSSNCTLGDDRPQDPGVVAYFNFDGTDLAIPCDRWNRVEHNVQAIALTVEAMRGMERWGAKNMIKAMFTGFKQLAAPGSHWSRVLDCDVNASPDEIRSIYRELAKKHHPDVGGSPTVMAEINRAYEAAMRVATSPEPRR